jgi:alkylhydroperoxidase family enzyme
MDPKYEPKFRDLERRLLQGPGTLDPSIRQAAAMGAELPEALARYVDTVRRHAYKVMDEDIENLVAQGYSEDQVFELTVAAAFGAARERLDSGLAAMVSREVPSPTTKGAEQ